MVPSLINSHLLNVDKFIIGMMFSWALTFVAEITKPFDQYCVLLQ